MSGNKKALIAKGLFRCVGREQILVHCEMLGMLGKAATRLVATKG